MHVMSGLDKPESGEIIIDGKNIINLKSSEVDKFRSKSIGFIFKVFSFKLMKVVMIMLVYR